MYNLTTTKLTLIQSINDAVHEYYNVPYIKQAKGGISKTNSIARAVSVGFCYHNIGDVKAVEISASIGLANHQTIRALNNFQAMMESPQKAQQLSKLWKGLVNSDESIKFAYEVVIEQAQEEVAANG